MYTYTCDCTDITQIQFRVVLLVVVLPGKVRIQNYASGRFLLKH